MTEGELSAAIAEVASNRPKYLRPYMREHFEEIVRLKSAGHTFYQIRDALIKVGVVMRGNVEPSYTAVYEAYRELQKPRQVKPRPKAEPKRARPRHSSEVEF